MLPEALSAALHSLLDREDPGELTRQGQALSLRYRQPERSGPLLRQGALAYAAARMPATYEAVAFALDQLPDLSPRTLVDAGAGPGTASWAALSRFPSLCSLIQWELDPTMIALGQALGTPGEYVRCDLTAPPAFSADLTVLCYALNELPGPQVAPLIDRLWQGTEMALVIVDPGTPQAWQTMMAVRDRLLAAGAHLAAPCAHSGPCPLPEGDWCHFARRVPRTRLHREVKGGERSFEDEKFTYLVFTRQPCPAGMRILRRPEYHKGMVQLSLCTAQGLCRRSVPRSRKEAYRRARDAGWGDRWEDSEP